MDENNKTGDHHISATPTLNEDTMAESTHQYTEMSSNNTFTQTTGEGEKLGTNGMASTIHATEHNHNSATESSSFDTTVGGNITTGPNEKERALEDAYEDEVSENNIKNATEGDADLTRTASSVQYIGGTQLYILMASMTLIFFLVMVDISIVSTVSSRSCNLFPPL